MYTPGPIESISFAQNSYKPIIDKKLQVLFHCYPFYNRLKSRTSFDSTAAFMKYTKHRFGVGHSMSMLNCTSISDLWHQCAGSSLLEYCIQR